MLAMSQICRLDHFGFLKVAGKDAVSFMQGYTTCNLDDLDEQPVKLGAVCNLQGRMLTSFLMVRQGTDVLLRMDLALVPQTIEFLSKYILFSKSSLEDISENFVSFGLPDVSKPEAPDLLPEGQGGFRLNLGNRQELWLPASSPPPDCASGEEAAACKLAWTDREIDMGLAWVTARTSEQFLPQMFNYHQLGAIDFDKGCYLGQEIVARMHYRGDLKRRLHRTDRPVESLPEGDLLVTGSRHSLVVLNNTSGQPVSMEASGETITATPL